MELIRLERRARTSRRRRAGTSMVEMVIVAPILLLLLFGIAEFGIAFSWWQTLSNAAREGARAGVVFDPNCAAGARNTQIINTVQNYASLLIPPTPNVSTNGAECAGSGLPLQVDADVAYNFQVLPGLAGIPSSITLRVSSVMRNE